MAGGSEKTRGTVLGGLLYFIRERLGLAEGYTAAKNSLVKELKTLQEIREEAETWDVSDNARDHIIKTDDAILEVECMLDEFRIDEQKRRAKRKQALLIMMRSFRYVDHLCHDAARKFGAMNRKLLEGIRSSVSLSSCLQQVRVQHGNVLRITENQDRLVKRRWELVPFLLAGAMASLSTDYSYVGREDEKNALLKHILPQSEAIPSTIVDEARKYKVITILGVKGSGKTKLAELIFDDKRVKEHFQHTEWIDVENHLDTIHVCRKVLEDSESKLTDNEVIHRARDSFFDDKRSLVVLDDVWGVSALNRIRINRVLKKCAPGSIIMVTTSFERVVDSIGTDHNHNILPLSPDNCWLILKQIALSTRPPEFCEEVMDIGIKIAKQCRGSPLDAQIMGHDLLSKDTKEAWQNVLDSSTEKSEKEKKDSWDGWKHFPQCIKVYNALPSQLRQCLSYCAVIPKSANIDVERLVRLWMAHNYVGQKNDKGRRKLGYQYFHTLSKYSIFENLVRGSIHTDKLTSCVMNGKFHDFMKSKAPKDLVWLGQKEGLRMETKDMLRMMQSFVALSPREIPEDLYKHLQRVKSLVLSSCQLEEVPSEIGKLVLLEYLDLSDNPIKELPDSICNLTKLEFLNLRSCYLLLSLPHRIGDLKERLMHLRINYTSDELHNLPQDFAKLTLILTLDVFMVGGRYTKDSIKKLRTLNNLEEIQIVVHGEVPFEDAELEKKTRMENLELCFIGKGRDYGNQSSIEDLKPPPQLQMLKLEGYPGSKLPQWITNDSLINSLTRLSLKSVNIYDLPNLWKLAFLEFLWLCNMPIAHLGIDFFGFPKKVQHENDHPNQSRIENLREEVNKEETSGHDKKHKIKTFTSLKTLRIEYLEKWKTWEDIEEGDEQKIAAMPILEELIINGCPKLKAHPIRMLRRNSWLKLHGDWFQGELSTERESGH